MMPNEAHIKDVEAYLADLQRLEINMAKDGSQVDKVVYSYMTKDAFYRRIEELRKMQAELEMLLVQITEKSGSRGRLMAEKAMTRFLEDTARRDLTQKQIRLIEQMNARRVEARLQYYQMRLRNEVGALEGDIKAFMTNARLSGRTRKEAAVELAKAAGDKQGLAAGFAKKAKRVQIDAARREAQNRALEQYHKVAKPGEKWQWITVSSTPCPDCQARAGVILPYGEWISMGIPGAGRTICGAACKCQLVPSSVSDEQFPDVKQFSWDKEKLVLTTFGEARRLGAKANQP